MSSEPFLRGLAFGFTIAAAVGPIAILCIRRTLASGYRVGLASGLGAATADAFYGAIAAFGVTAIAEVLIGERRILALAGGVALVFLGARTFASRPRETKALASGGGITFAYSSILGLTLANPMTILSFAGLVAGLGLGAGGGVAAAAMVAGVFCGSAAWWAVLTSATTLLRARVSLEALRWLNAVSGLVVAAFGVAALAAGIGG